MTARRVKADPGGSRRRERMARRTKLSELEGAVLGTLREMEPCTPYAIRRIFQSSPSPIWSGSAGAIYPLVARLEKRGLLRSEETMTGRRRGRLFALTAGGLRSVRSWLGPPLPIWAVGVPMDALRTRARFLGALPPKRRQAFIAEAQARLRSEIRVVEADCRSRSGDRDPFSRLTARGALLMLRAREAWLKELRAATIARRV
jgi:DNA-binding PadR family transcriptional regulator